MFIAPPRILGPVNTLSTYVTIVGTFPGATVHLLYNSTPPGSPVGSVGYDLINEVTATTSTVEIPIQSGQLSAGQELSSSQKVGNDFSEFSRFTQIVGSAPARNSDLSSVIFLAGIYNCTDWVLVSGLTVGATVEILYQGLVIGSEIVVRPTMSVKISRSLQVGERLEAVQRLMTPQGNLQSSIVTSLPVERLPNLQQKKLVTPSTLNI